MRRIDELLTNYSNDHQNPANQRMHLVCVPLIVWTVTAMLWCIPVPESLLKPGFWFAFALFFTWMYYWKLSKSLALGTLLGFVAFGFINYALAARFGIDGLLKIAIGVFIVAWIGQFIGHKWEGKRPSFFTDLVYLLIGPLWTLSKLYKKTGIAI
ncbi:MAG: hypothetical protein RIS67_331 [Pseudomonadota bacterium]|jgi:uncharacterized membrane protein YGL010W